MTFPRGSPHGRSWCWRRGREAVGVNSSHAGGEERGVSAPVVVGLAAHEQVRVIAPPNPRPPPGLAPALVPWAMGTPVGGRPGTSAICPSPQESGPGAGRHHPHGRPAAAGRGGQARGGAEGGPGSGSGFGGDPGSEQQQLQVRAASVQPSRARHHPPGPGNQ